MTISNEAKVGILVTATLILALLFAWAIGIDNPLRRSLQLYVTYQFAGGVEVGSPVRVSGIKVGKVEKIEFFTPSSENAIALKEPGSAESLTAQAVVPVKLRISIRPDAAGAVRHDSRFYINLAGLIGERYIEITPGNATLPPLHSGDTVPGVDPPRIDQLLSQSFNLAGKIKDLIDKNSGDITRSIELVYKLSENLNKTLAWMDKNPTFRNDITKLTGNLVAITSDVRKVTDSIHTPEGEKTLALLNKLLLRLEPLDSDAIRNFFQKEGIRAKIF